MKNQTVYLLFIIFINFVNIRGDTHCPSNCVCKRRTVDCSSRTYRTTIPEKIPISTEILNLASAVSYVEEKSLIHLRHLSYLCLANNLLLDIPSRAFNNLNVLQSLLLQGNRIQYLDPNTFQGLYHLKKLNLHSNHIAYLESGIFRHLGKLESLWLNKNSLRKLQNGIFDGLKRLKFLYIFNNKITVIQNHVFEETQELEELFLQKNMIHEIQPRLFSNLRLLKRLYLHHNRLTHLQSAAFENMDNLKILNLAFNNLNCDCQIKQLVLLKNENHYLNIQGQCTGPSDVAGKYIQNLPETFISCDVENTKLTKPRLLVRPQDQLTEIGEAFVRFTCTATGNPTPTVTWFFNDSQISPSIRIQILNDSIIIKNIQYEDAGIYKCRMQNLVGEKTESATLHVSVNLEQHDSPFIKDNPQDGEITLVPSFARGNSKRADNSPHIVIRPQDTEGTIGMTVQMPCEIQNNEDATMEWRKEGSLINEDERVSISGVHSLIITNLSISDAAVYECLVFNDFGKDSASAVLRVTNNVEGLPKDDYVNIALTMAQQDIEQAINNTVNYLFNNNSDSINIHDLFKITRFPNAKAIDLARAAEIYELTLQKVKEYIQKGRNVTSANEFSYRDELSAQHLEKISRLSGCTAHREHNNCSEISYHKKYRSIDGSCNNLEHPMWGSSLTGFRRILAPIYENSFSTPVGWNRDRKYNGFLLPSARHVSVSIISTKDITEDNELTHMTMQWGQWLDHDLDHALPSVSSQTWDGVDCKKTCNNAAPCFPMDVPAHDPRISNRRCIDFIRTSAVCGSGLTSAIYGKLQQREQINQLTSYIDASQVYGYEKKIAEDLRDLSNDNGLLRVGVTNPGQKALLPTTGINAMDCRRNLNESVRACFVTGDIRGNEQIGLTAMHTIWLREHNRIASQLKKNNPNWNGEQIYQEARKIVGAQMQIITYEHWLPLILGPKGYEKLGKYSFYNKNINPSISNVFATAALRFGHSMINPILNRYDENFEPIPQGHLLLRNAFFAPWRLIDEGGVDPLLRGMFVTPAKLKTPTQNLNSELTEKLFYSAHAVALDLAAMNIQRGRDHAIPFYNKWRTFCNMTDINSFDDLLPDISDLNVLHKLKKLYGTVYNIDVWVGGILENTVQGGKVGLLFRCILTEQFKRLRDGDRFWYENPAVFKPTQLQELKKTSLARVLCDNGDNINTIAENVFLLQRNQDDFISCDDLPSIDLNYWKDDIDNDILTANMFLEKDSRELVLLQRIKDLEQELEDLRSVCKNHPIIAN